MKKAAVLLLALASLFVSACVETGDDPEKIAVPDLDAMKEELGAVTAMLQPEGDYLKKIGVLENELNQRVSQDKLAPDDVKTVVALLTEVADLDDTAFSKLKRIEHDLDTLGVYQSMGQLQPTTTVANPAVFLESTVKDLAEVSTRFTAAGAGLREALSNTRDYVTRAMGHYEKTNGLTGAEAHYRYYNAPDSLVGQLDKVDGAWNGFQDRHFTVINRYRVNMLVFFLILCGAILWFIREAKRGKELTIRRISGLAAVEEAVGRATEMGKPVLYVTGILDIDDIQTLAGLNILGHVAYKTAEYESQLTNPHLYPMPLSSAQEIVKEAYLKAGKPDLYRNDICYYMTQDQFAFAAGVSGIMLREKPAAAIYMGSFYAESLLLAEVGTQIGSIQIAGTAQVSQLPFFVAACDYTLIGEELFAASAYLSREPTLLGSLKGQDAGKAFIMAAILAGCFLEFLVSFGWLSTSFSIVEFFRYR